MTDSVDTLVRGTLVNVHTGTLETGAVAIDNGIIVALDERPATREIETEFVAPGLIDAHMHVESSMVTLPRYGAAVVPRGVTSVVWDPHEIGNICGERGIRAAIGDAKHTPLKARFTVPSSVPASDLQDAGATLDADDIATLLDEPSVVALGEVMNIPGVVAGDSGVHAKIDAARECGLPVDGHLPSVRGADLHEAARYLDTDHESITLAEARTKADIGLRVYLREGSSSKNLTDLLELVETVDTRSLSLCTDDRDVTDLTERGGVDFAVVKAIREGADPATAVQMATLNTAESYDLPFGRLRPGSPADLVLLSDLRSWEVEHVLIDGVLDPTANRTEPPASAIATDTVSFDPVDGADLAIEATEGAGEVTVRVIDAVGGLQTERMEATVPRSGGILAGDGDADVLPLGVVERHGANAGIGRGFVHGLGLDRGAVGSTVAHDAHNVVVAGTSHEALATVANHLRRIGGGVAAYDPEAEGADTDGVTALSLPIAGLMSDEPLDAVAETFGAVENTARRIGLDHPGGIMELSFLTLEVIPEFRLTNNGLVDTTSMSYVDTVIS
jgi:adenine deaminase